MKSITDYSDNSIKSQFTDLVDNNNMFTSLDYVNLKIASRPVKFYKLIHCEKKKIHDYFYIIEKIKSASQLKTESITLFLKINGPEEIRINTADEWKLYFENSGKSILELIDSKNTIKIEFTTISFVSQSCDNLNKILEDPQNSKIDKYDKNDIIDKNEEKLKNLFDDDQFGLQIIKTLFSLSLKNEKIKSIIKTDVLSKMPKTQEQILNSKSFDVYLKNFFKKTIENFQNISQFKEILMKESQKDESDSDILFESTEDERIMEVPSFCQFYKQDEIENLRSKIISESFADIKNKI
jgi:hypothetical protein